MLTSPISLLAVKLLFALLALVGILRFVAHSPLLLAPQGLRGLAGALCGAGMGTKIGFVLQFPMLLLEADAQTIWITLAGNSVPGAVAGGAVGLLLAGRPLAAELADALFPAVLLVLLILDLGALFWALTETGFGAPARRWGIDFGDGIERHPVMLYDAAAMGALLWVGRATRPKVLGAGVQACMLASACFGIWLLLAFLQPPFGPVLMTEAVFPRPLVYAPGLTGEQWLCLVSAWCLCFAAWRTMPKRP